MENVNEGIIEESENNTNANLIEMGIHTHMPLNKSDVKKDHPTIVPPNNNLESVPNDIDQSEDSEKNLSGKPLTL